MVKPGRGSLTDTTLIRKFSPHSPDKIVYETRSKVYINKNLSILDAMLDLAHELTHFAMRKGFNPYAETFNLKRFIRSTVEGKGGEVEAYLVECQVLKELYPDHLNNKSKCLKVMDGSGKFSKHYGVKEFYKVGHYMDEFKEEIGPYKLEPEHLPHLSGNDALFISSAYGMPYPLAAVKEYLAIMGKVCENDERRLGIMERQMGRSIASERVAASQSVYKQMKNSYQNRCRPFIDISSKY